MVPENGFPEAGSAVGVFSWVTLSSDYRFKLQVEWIRARRQATWFSWSRLFKHWQS